MNRVVSLARRRGVLIIHAPSGTIDHYADHPARRLAADVPKAASLPEGIAQWCHWENDTEFNKWLSASLGIGVGDKVGLFLEGFTVIDDDGDGTDFFDAGLTFLIKPDLQLDFRVGTGSSDEVDETFFGAGIVTRF